MTLKTFANRLFGNILIPLIIGFFCWFWIKSHFEGFKGSLLSCLFGALVGSNINELALLWRKRRERKLEAPRPSSGEATTQDATLCDDHGVDSGNH